MSNERPGVWERLNTMYDTQHRTIAETFYGRGPEAILRDRCTTPMSDE